MTQTTSADSIEELIRFFRSYYRKDVGQLAEHYPQEQKSLYVDWRDLFQFDRDIADRLLEEPDQVLTYLQEALWLYDLPVDQDLTGAHVRVYNLPDSWVLDPGAVSRHQHIGRLLDVQGQVAKTSKVKPRHIEAAFECQRCGTRTDIPQRGDDLQSPHECQGCDRQGPFQIDHDASTMTDHQLARIQQPPERARGGEGESIDVHLEDDLIEEIDAGDRVTLTGVLQAHEDEKGKSRNVDTSVSGQAVVCEESDYEDIDVDDHLEEIRAIARGDYGDPFELLVDSIRPGHYGDEDVKLAIALQLFGGGVGGEARTVSHILLLGDPGTGKSSLLEAVDELAPRSTYASGKGASAAGLTAAAVDDDFGDSRWGLEAGALVLADDGVACIDEIDKVHPDAVSSLHGALESLKVRVNKAGINASLSARTSVLAAGNPKNGRFDDYQPRAQQIDMGPALMSRFDLIFMVSDQPDPETDGPMVDHMMRTRRAEIKRERGEKLSEEEVKSIDPAIPYEILRAYIAYAKENVTPYMPENGAAQEHHRKEFLKLRMANSDGDDMPVPVTARSSEAIARFAEASARVRLSDEVTLEDVERALSLVRRSMNQVGIDPETGEFDADIIETGQSMSQDRRRKQILAAIEDGKGDGAAEIAGILDLDLDRVEHDIQQLKDVGEIYELNGELHRT